MPNFLEFSLAKSFIISSYFHLILLPYHLIPFDSFCLYFTSNFFINLNFAKDRSTEATLTGRVNKILYAIIEFGRTFSRFCFKIKLRTSINKSALLFILLIIWSSIHSYTRSISDVPSRCNLSSLRSPQVC